MMYSQNRPEPVSVPPAHQGGDITKFSSIPTPTPTSASASGMIQNRLYKGEKSNDDEQNVNSNKVVDQDAVENTEEALLDLAQLEELHEEAERMKAVGNKHMAAQEYMQAYNAYSAALQLSPVGPSSHVFLSNRAAALLSLKRYQAAATDARRAVALAPTFGKAHARLGQALYFLKDYNGAVSAYQDAISYEPDNPVTKTYLDKAKMKLERQRTDGSSASVAESTAITLQNSVATDPAAQHNVVESMYNRGTSTERVAMLKATAKTTTSHNTNNNNIFSSSPQVEDPEFDEAVRIQQRANSYLVNKQYKQAIEEYTAALFLVPDDVNLSPDLHLGRAHALNGSRRHEAARNDAQLAIKLQKSAAAYSTLAKSLFYMKDFQGAIDAFTECEKYLPEGETLGMFDLAYLEKAEKAVADRDASLDMGSNRSVSSKSVPKLPPPRFVPREEAIQSPAAVRSMPKEWPQQNQMSRIPLKVGPERDIICLTESLGVKLNRGSDGIVRVLTVTEITPESNLVRKGDIRPGDVVREAAGVDIRRPITNIMWGDTVALIKMAPRPITLTVAEELSPVPPAVLDEQKKARERNPKKTESPRMERPSPASDDSPVAKSDDVDANAVETESAENSLDQVNDETTSGTKPPADDPPTDDPERVKSESEIEAATDISAHTASAAAVLTDEDDDIVEVEDGDDPTRPKPSLDTVVEATDEERTPESSVVVPNTDSGADNDDIESVEDGSTNSSPLKNMPQTPTKDDDSYEMPQTSLREQEEKAVGGEILFLRDSPPAYCGWDTLKWMSHNGARKVNFCQPVYRLEDGTKKRKGLPLFWKTGSKHFEERALVVYDEPSLLLIVRRPETIEEVRKLLGLPPDVTSGKGDGSADSDWALNPETALKSYWILESVADPKTSKLRLSPLTTASSSARQGADDRERSCFQLLTPTEQISLSALNVREDTKRNEQSFSDSGAFLETLSIESAIAQALCSAHSRSSDLGNSTLDIAWKHQIIIGSLHSLVLSGNLQALDEGIEHARRSASTRGKESIGNNSSLPSRIVDALDDNGFPALYYACSHENKGATKALINAGADISFQTEVEGLSMAHIAARNLDDSTLSLLLTAKINPNALDKKGRTPLYVAAVEGSALNRKNPEALARCLSLLKTCGGMMMPPGSPETLRNPISALAYMWLPQYLSVLLDHVPYRYPLIRESNMNKPIEMSLSALYQYPVHSALVALRKQARKNARPTKFSSESKLVQTLRVLFEHGFEPNERLDGVAFGAENTSLHEFVGYSPIQILGLIALELDSVKNEIDQAAFVDCRRIIFETAKFLLRNGARLSLDPPMASRPRSNSNEEPNDRKVEILTKKMDADKVILSLLGGEEALNEAQKGWAKTKKVATMVTKYLLEDDSVTFEDTTAAGGSNSVSCAICWSTFGALMNRKHKCRVTKRYVCDECSTNRLVQITTEYRLSDGQFLLAKVDAVNENKGRSPSRDAQVSSDRARAAARLDRLESEEKSNRDSLFGGVMEAATNFMMGDDGQQEETASEKIEGMTASLDQTRDALNQRGEKLASLGDKSAKMAQASKDFADMAKELNKKSNFFW